MSDEASRRGRVDLRLVGPALATWLGAFVGTGLPLRWTLVLLAMLGLSIPAARVRGRRAPALVGLAVCVVAAGGMGALRVLALSWGPVDDLARSGETVRAAAVVTGDPHVAGTAAAWTGGRELVVVPARLQRVDVAGRPTRVRAPVLLFAEHPAWRHLLPGQDTEVVGRLAPARAGQPLAAVMSVRGPPELTGRPGIAQRVAGDLRTGLRSAVRNLPPSERGLVPGLVVGDTSQLPEPLESDFRVAGMTHLVAVSGANLAIVAGFVVHTARLLGVRGRLLPLLGLASIVGFVVLARPQPSVLRAAVMGTVGLSALASGRRRRSLAALAGATLVLLLVDPWLSRSYGFALSVLATGGLLLLAPGLTRWLRERGLPEPVAQAVAAPSAAQVACAPVVVLLSGQVSLVAVPANLVAAPAVAPATVVGLLVTLAHPVSTALAQALGWAAGLPAWWIVTVAEHAAGLPLAALSWPSSLVGALVLVVLLVAAVAVAPRAARHRALVVAAAVSLVGSAMVVASRPGWPPPGWVLVACDVGQGDALVLSAGPAGAVLVDAGPDPRAIDTCLRRLGVDRVALVLLTHLHADHIAGLPGVLRGRSVDEVMIGPYDEPPEGLQWVRRWTGAAGVPLTRSVTGSSFRLGPLSWRVLAPSGSTPPEAGDDGSGPNNASVVLLARGDGITMLLTGDIEPAAQRALMRAWAAEPVDVLKVAHHGSAYQAPELLDVLRPRIGLVSVGTANDYGHPARRTLRDLASGGAIVGRTDRDGSLAVVGPAGRLRLVRARR